MLPLQSLQPHGLLWASEFWLRLLRKPQVVQGMRLPGRLHLPRRLESLQAVLADCFQHDEAWLLTLLFSLLQQTLVEEGRDSFKHRGGLFAIRLAHGFGSLEGAATHEHGDAPEELLLIRSKQVVAPLERASSVCWRAGASRAPLVKRTNRWPKRPTKALSDTSLIR